jgi:hypothetical protein
MSDKLYSEIFEEFATATNKAERLAVLKKYDHKNFREFLVAAFNPLVVFDVELPETYRPAIEPAGLNFTYLSMEMPKLYRFIKDHPKRSANLTEKKKTDLFRVILESLHKDEARLLVSLVQKKIDVKFLTPNLVREAYPNIQI